MTRIWMRLKKIAPSVYEDILNSAKIAADYHDIEPRYWGCNSYRIYDDEDFEIVLEYSQEQVKHLREIANQLGVELGFCEAFLIPTFCEGDCEECIFPDLMERAIDLERDTLIMEGDREYGSPYWLD